MNEGAAIGQDGSPHSGAGAAGSACGRLLAYFRERTGQLITGKTMDDEISELHGDRNASTRKRGICEQIDPRVEWITCTRRRLDGHLRFYYRHVYTRGRVPFEKPLREGGLTPESRLAEIRQGTRVPPASYYRVASQAGLLPEGFDIPAPVPTAYALKHSIEACNVQASPAALGQGNLWDDAPRPR